MYIIFCIIAIRRQQVDRSLSTTAVVYHSISNNAPDDSNQIHRFTINRTNIGSYRSDQFVYRYVIWKKCNCEFMHRCEFCTATVPKHTVLTGTAPLQWDCSGAKLAPVRKIKIAHEKNSQTLLLLNLNFTGMKIPKYRKQSYPRHLMMKWWEIFNNDFNFFLNNVQILILKIRTEMKTTISYKYLVLNKQKLEHHFGIFFWLIRKSQNSMNRFWVHWNFWGGAGGRF